MQFPNLKNPVDVKQTLVDVEKATKHGECFRRPNLKLPQSLHPGEGELYNNNHRE